ncbi:hypothetical protein GGF49_006029, partial [Coemansia sp. RSA 1853]
MYSNITRSATTADTAIRVNGTRNTAPEPATHNSKIAKLTEENATQREKIAELEATIERLEIKHADELRSIDDDLVQLAGCVAHRLARDDAEREKLNKRVELAESRVAKLEKGHAAQVAVNRTEHVIQYCRRYVERVRRAGITAGLGMQADRLVQLVDERSNKLAGKAADRQNILEIGLVQPVDECCNGLSHLINKLRMVRASKANSLIRNSMLADKHAIPEVLYDQVGAAKNKITRYKEMAHRIVELLRAHQCRQYSLVE